MMRDTNNSVPQDSVPQDKAHPDRSSTPVVMYTTAWCVDCWRAKQVMDSMKVEYTEVDIMEDEEAIELVMRLNRGHRSVPTLVFPDGSIMTEPRTVALVEKLRSLL